MFSRKELVDNYVTFLVAGGDPTAHTMSFFLNEIVQNPKVYAKLQAELDRIISDGVAIPTAAMLNEMPYLTMVVKETLRKNGPGNYY